MIRVGLGYDIHKLVEGRKLILGGVVFDYNKGEEGHSDGDVLYHAIIDSLLGASGLGDIGSFFPPEDMQYKDIDSGYLAKIVIEKIYAENWKIENIDCVIKIEKPKFIPYRDEVIGSIAKILKIDKSQVFVKAKTGEKMGDVGLGNAVEVWCTCLLSK
jgi:2-C-methyl-D-erythritol 2,4-cyclodiphosphate synthase